MLRTILASAVLVFPVTAPPALAASDADAPSAVVHYADLDLSRAGGVAVLQNRIRAAIGKVCGDADYREIWAVREVERCRRVALASANAQVASALDRAQQLAVGEELPSARP